RRRHTRFSRDWSSDVCSSDLLDAFLAGNSRGNEQEAQPELTNLVGSHEEFESWVDFMKAGKAKEKYPMPAQVASARVFRYKAALRQYSEARRGTEPDRYWKAMLLVVTAADA